MGTRVLAASDALSTVHVVLSEAVLSRESARTEENASEVREAEGESAGQPPRHGEPVLRACQQFHHRCGTAKTHSRVHATDACDVFATVKVPR